MKKSQRFLMAVLSVCVSCVANAQQPIMSDPSKSIVVQPNQSTVTLNLKSNATTGFGWFYQASKPSWLTPVKHNFVAPSTKLVGAPGYDVWTFNVPNISRAIPRMATITMRYARPWDIQASKPTTFYVVFAGQ